MDACEGEELVEFVETTDIANLDDKRRCDRRADACDRPQTAGEIAIEKFRDSRLGSLDLALRRMGS